MYSVLNALQYFIHYDPNNIHETNTPGGKTTRRVE
ncbi:uncharacterized protein METZ01_LOCUS117824 [marine metagenome]|uniref:Uncharacterized protein n=1 Tax=marine metagenome TaxID=408172 RepID=A0A381XK31_9ZZZZ